MTAQQDLDRAMEMVDGLVGRIATDLGALSDASEDRMVEVLARAEDSFEDFLAAIESGDPAHMLRHAELLNGFSTAYLSLGDPQRALETATAASALLERVGGEAVEPGQAEELAVALISEGDARSELGDAPGAAAAYARATQLREGLLAAAPEDRDLRRRLSIVYEREGQAMAAAGSLDDAERRLSQAIAIREDLATGGDNPQALEALAAAYSSLADIEAHRGRQAQATGRYDQAIETYDRLVAADGTNRAWQDRRATSLARSGRAHLAADSHSAGIEALARAGDAYQELVEAEPANRLWRARLAEVMEWKGAGHLARHDLPAARALLMGSLDIRRRLADEGNGTVDNQRAFAGALIALAEVDRAESIDDAARGRVGEAIAIFREVRAAQPASRQAAAELARALATGADFGLDARENLEEAQSTLDAIQADTGDPEFQALAEDVRQRLDSPSQ